MRCIFLSIVFLTILLQTAVSQNGSQWYSFNEGWKFTKGDSVNARFPDYNDNSWQPVAIPHDWAIFGPLEEKLDGNTGKLPWRGVGWYRKTFTVDQAEKGNIVYLMFDGIMSSPKIYINGTLAGSWDYGYNSFYVNVTDFIDFGKKNTIAIFVDNRNHGSRWYPGAGIYRKISMKITNPLHTQVWGTYVTTPVITKTYADVRILTTVNNFSPAEKEVMIQSRIISPEGREIAGSQTKRKIAPGKNREFDHWITVNNPALWDIENPVIYKVETIVKDGEKVLDISETPFGFRTFSFTADDGFHLNGRRLPLYGVNLHHDHGPLGAVFNLRAMERQLEIMKEMGCNAIRTSHNVCAPELIELCDKMGFIVFDEAFDKWDNKADISDTTSFQEFGERNIRNFVMRDRNSPSVVIWSVGNEMGDIQGNVNGGLQKLAEMVGYVRKYDITRPVTMACDQDGNARWRHFDFYDVHSWNYNQRWEPARKIDPSKSVIISESGSTVSTRGFYELPLPEKKTDFTKSNQVSSYDLHVSYWVEIPDDDFIWQENNQYIAGEFI